MHWAAWKDHKNVAELLLTKHADVNARNEKSETPLHWAATFGHKDVAELLLANRADVNARNSSGTTPLNKAAFQDHKAVVELLLANKAEINLKTIADVLLVVEYKLYHKSAGGILSPPSGLFESVDQEFAAKGHIKAGDLVKYIQEKGEKSQVTEPMTHEAFLENCELTWPNKEYVYASRSTELSKFSVVVVFAE